MADSTNTLIVVDAKGLFSSPLATKEGWGRSYQAAYDRGLENLPTDIDAMFVYSKVLTPAFIPAWRVGMIQFSDDPSIDKIAMITKGGVETISGIPVVHTPNNAFLIKTAPKMLGLMNPADRQLLARWLKDIPPDMVSNAPRYLKDAARSASPTTVMLVAMDLSNTDSPDSIRELIKDSTVINRDRLANVEGLTRFLTGIQGICLELKVGESMQGSLRIDFDQSVNIIAPYGRALITEALDGHGALIEDFQSWNVRYSGMSVYFEGTMTRPGMRQVFQVVQLPTVHGARSATTQAMTAASGSNAPDNNASSPANVAAASKYYFNTTQRLYDELKKQQYSSNSRAATLMDRFARQIDDLPILNVDPELLDFSRNLSSNLRRLAESRLGINLTTANATATAAGAGFGGGGGGYGNGGYGGYGYGYGAYPSLKMTQSVTKKQATVSDAVFGIEMDRSVQDQFAAMRQKMVAKYQIEF